MESEDLKMPGAAVRGGCPSLTEGLGGEGSEIGRLA